MAGRVLQMLCALTVLIAASAAYAQLTPGGLVVGNTPIQGTCTSGYNLYSNNGFLGCQASSLVVGTTAITNGTNTDIEYNNNGVLGELATSGSGAVALVNSPSFTTPNLGTPSAVTLTNGTGLPVTGLASLGTGVATALGTAVTGSGGGIVLATGPTFTSSGTVTLPDAGTLTSAGMNSIKAIGVGESAPSAGGIYTSGLVAVGGQSTTGITASSTNLELEQGGSVGTCLYAGSGGSLDIGSTSCSAANATDILTAGGTATSSNGIKSLTIDNPNTGASAGSVIYFQNNTASTEVVMQLNGGANTGGNGENSFTINGKGGTWLQGGSDNAIGISTAGAITLYNQPTTGSITYAVCAATGANGTGGGALILDTSTTICGLSAARFKNLEPAEAISPQRALAALDGLRLEPWTFKPQYGDGGNRQHVSLIADDVEKMDPRCIERDEHGRVHNYDDRCIEVYTVGAIRALMQQNKQLQREVGLLREELRTHSRMR